MVRTASLIAAVVLVASAVVAGAPPPRPKEARPTEWPLARFVQNLDARLAAAPEDAGAHYTLGRVHAFAFALERTTLLGGGSEEFTWLKDFRAQLEHAPLDTLPMGPDERRAHLAEGVRHLSRACALEDSALHRLTLAWLFEAGAPFAPELDSAELLGSGAPESPAERAEFAGWIEALGSADESAGAAEEARRRLSEPATLARALAQLDAARSTAEPARRAAVHELLRRAWTERAIAEYRRCLDLAEAEGLFEDPMRNGPLAAQVPREALEAWRRLVRARGVRDAKEEAQLVAADARWDALGQPTRAWITPMLLALEGCATLDELTRPALAVPFDLDGDGVDELWPWLAPEAGWLVWDPSGTGEILSGRQLFGSASGWLFFEHGYRVLDALDDDRNGELSGAELAGIAVWFDRDSDGISDLGEVVSVETLGIVALATAAQERIGDSLGNPCGVEFTDGRVLPTYDWVLAPMEEP